VARAARRQRIISPIRLARRAGFYRGLLGGNRGWMAVGALLWVGRTAKRTLGRSEQRVSFDRLEPGQGLEIRTIVPPTRAERRTARRSG